MLLGTAWGIFEIGLILFSDQKVDAVFRSGNPQVLFSFAAIIALHALTAFLMGVLVSASIESGKLKHLKIILFPVLLHLLFNFLIIQKGDFTNYLVIATLTIAFFAGLVVLVFNRKKLA